MRSAYELCWKALWTRPQRHQQTSGLQVDSGGGWNMLRSTWLVEIQSKMYRSLSLSKACLTSTMNFKVEICPNPKSSTSAQWKMHHSLVPPGWRSHKPRRAPAPRPGGAWRVSETSKKSSTWSEHVEFIMFIIIIIIIRIYHLQWFSVWILSAFAILGISPVFGKSYSARGLPVRCAEGFPVHLFGARMGWFEKCGKSRIFNRKIMKTKWWTWFIMVYQCLSWLCHLKSCSLGCTKYLDKQKMYSLHPKVDLPPMIKRDSTHKNGGLTQKTMDVPW